MQESGNTAWVGLLIFVILFWDGMLLLLFGEVAFVGFRRLLLIWVTVRRRHTPPAPLERGDCDACSLLVMSGLGVWFPLLRGDKGVCYGERRGLG